MLDKILFRIFGVLFSGIIGSSLTETYIKYKNFRRDKLSDKSLSKNLFVRNLRLFESLSRRTFLHGPTWAMCFD